MVSPETTTMKAEGGMKAVLLYEYGGPEQLRYEETDVPKPGNDEVLVKMHATSANPIDFKLRSGEAQKRMPLELPAILGRDLAGEVVESGQDVTNFPNGTRVMALTNRAYAEYVIVKAKDLAQIPDGLSFEQAAALPLVVTTGAQLIEMAVKPQSEQRILVTGALGSVGRTAVHVAIKHGAQVLAGVRDKEKKDAATLNAEEVIGLDNQEEIGDLHDLDAIADTVGGKTIQSLFKTLRTGGILGSVLGKPEGADQYDIQVEVFMAHPDSARLNELAKDVARGEFSIPIARTMKLKDIQEAHRLAEAGGAGGKIVLIP
jgi:NADPH:quinone reductase-like Zn-dependent oxidoreductase